MESRASELSYIERVWCSRSDDVDRMTSVANPHSELVFWEQGGQVRAAVLGPEPAASEAPVPANATFFGISFAHGVSMSHMPVSTLVGGSTEIPDVSRRSVWLKDRPGTGPITTTLRNSYSAWCGRAS